METNSLGLLEAVRGICLRNGHGMPVDPCRILYERPVSCPGPAVEALSQVVLVVWWSDEDGDIFCLTEDSGVVPLHDYCMGQAVLEEIEDVGDYSDLEEEDRLSIIEAVTNLRRNYVYARRHAPAHFPKDGYWMVPLTDAELYTTSMVDVSGKVVDPHTVDAVHAQEPPQYNLEFWAEVVEV